MIQFASQMGMENETRELALECYTELLELLDFMLLPGVLLRQAECLLYLVSKNYSTYRKHSMIKTTGESSILDSKLSSKMFLNN